MRHSLHTQRVRLALGFGAAALLGLQLLGCAGSAPVAGLQSPRWACPSPTPQPFGSAGPVKSWIDSSTTIRNPAGTPETVVERTPVYYDEYEREYGATAAGPPYPTPTPYGLVGATYTLGQRVDLGVAHVTVQAQAGPTVPGQTDAANTVYQLYYIDIMWDNHGAQPFAYNYGLVTLAAVTQPNGAIRTDSGWTPSGAAQSAANIASPPAAVAVGASTARIAILAPAGTPQTVALGLVGLPPSGPNSDLRQTGTTISRITWTAAVLSVGPPCTDTGAVTSWQNATGVAWGHTLPMTIAAPAGAPRVLEVALAQVGKPYIWGAKGPDVFDCSGLMTWSYAQIGISIPQGTAGQFPRMKPVATSALQAGDLVFFALAGNGQVDHVGMVADVDGDGTWDLVHAASPKYGIIISKNFLASAYYGSAVAGFRTVR